MLIKSVCCSSELSLPPALARVLRGLTVAAAVTQREVQGAGAGAGSLMKVVTRVAQEESRVRLSEARLGSFVIRRQVSANVQLIK